MDNGKHVPAWALHCRVLVDGEMIPTATYADEEAGLVVCGVYPLDRVLRGKVRIELRENAPAEMTKAYREDRAFDGVRGRVIPEGALMVLHMPTMPPEEIQQIREQWQAMYKGRHACFLFGDTRTEALPGPTDAELFEVLSVRRPSIQDTIAELRKRYALVHVGGG